MIDLSSRRREAEWMDAPDADPEWLRKSLAFIRRVNVLFGYTRATLSHFERFSAGWRRGETIRILDVATGSADIPRAILRWAQRRGFDVRVVGIDLHAKTLSEASIESNGDARLRLVRADALCLPFADNSFDYAVTNMFLHHLDDDQIVVVLREMARVARRGIVAADLNRNARAYRWIGLFTLWANPMVRHDARVSVAQAFTRDEVLALRERAGVGFASYYQHFGHRFVLAGQKADGEENGFS
ncbi:MAG TPA: methyltransferase domain-containing protein [Tepidisphaeraceae bacterium]